MREVPARRSSVEALPPDSTVLRAMDLSAWASVVVKGSAEANLSTQLSGVAIGRVRARGQVLIARPSAEKWIYLGASDDVALAVAGLDLTGTTSVVDRSHARTLLRLSGPGATELLGRWSVVNSSEVMLPDLAFAVAQVAGVACEIIRADLDFGRSYIVGFDQSNTDWLLARLFPTEDLQL